MLGRTTILDDEALVPLERRRVGERQEGAGREVEVHDLVAVDVGWREVGCEGVARLRRVVVVGGLVGPLHDLRVDVGRGGVAREPEREPAQLRRAPRLLLGGDVRQPDVLGAIHPDDVRAGVGRRRVRTGIVAYGGVTDARSEAKRNEEDSIHRTRLSRVLLDAPLDAVDRHEVLVDASSASSSRACASCSTSQTPKLGVPDKRSGAPSGAPRFHPLRSGAPCYWTTPQLRGFFVGAIGIEPTTPTVSR